MIEIHKNSHFTSKNEKNLKIRSKKRRSLSFLQKTSLKESKNIIQLKQMHFNDDSFAIVPSLKIISKKYNNIYLWRV